MIPAEFRESGLKDYGPPHSTWRDVVSAWDEDEFALDPTRLTLLCGEAGFDGTTFKGLLAERFDIQINKTSRNSVLVQININNTRGDAAHLIKALADLSREIDDRLARDGSAAREALSARVKALTVDVPDLPNFSHFHDAFRDDAESSTSEGHMREAFFKAYDEASCDYVRLNSPEMDRAAKERPAACLGQLRHPVSARLPDHGARPSHHQRGDHLHAQARCEGDPRLPGRPRGQGPEAGPPRRAAEANTIQGPSYTDSGGIGVHTRSVPP